MKQLATIFCAAVLIAGCQTATSHIGEGALEVSSRVATAMEGYFRLDHPLAMAITTDGRHAARSYCSTSGCEVRFTENESIQNALGHCRKNAGDRTCKIYALGKKVVWNGPVTNRASIWSPSKPTEQRATLKWQGYETDGTLRMVSGIAEFLDGGKQVALRFQSHPNFMGTCGGNIDVPEGNQGQWTLNCTKAPTVEGSIKLNSKDRSGNGYARDRYGRQVELKIFPR